MSFQYEGFEGVAAVEPERALNIGMGVAAAPLWAAFYASAGLGAAWWWSMAWARPTARLNVEALLEPTPAAEALIAAVDETVSDLIEASHADVAAKAYEAETVAEAVHESVEIAGETAVEAVEFAHAEVAEAIEEARADIAEDLTAAEAPAAETVASDAPAAEIADAPVAELAEIAPTAEIRTFKPSKKKSPKTDA